MQDFPYPYDANSLPPAAPIRLRPDLRFWRMMALLLLIGVGLVLLNLSMYPLAANATATPGSFGEFWLFLSMGIVGAEASLLAIAAVFGPGSPWLRRPTVLVLGLIFVLAWLMGYALMERIYLNKPYFPGLDDFLSTLLILPILFCVCEVPLWVFRTLFRWRMVRHQDVTPLKHSQLSIANILVATAFVAVSLAAVRQSGIVMSEGWRRIGNIAALTAGSSLAVLPFTMGVVFRRWPTWVGMPAAAAWISLIFYLLFTVLCLLTGFTPTVSSWCQFAAFTVSFTSVLLAPLLLTRVSGYRLLWGKEDAVPSAPL